MTTATQLTQEEILHKLYRDITRLAGEIAVDRCRNRVLLKLVRDRLGVSEEELNTLFREELEQNLEGFCHDITAPMLSELEEDSPSRLEDVSVVATPMSELPASSGGGCCQGTQSCGS